MHLFKQIELLKENEKSCTQLYLGVILNETKPKSDSYTTPQSHDF